MYKEELERRLNLSDYTRLPNLLELGRTYYDITDENDFKKMLCVADRYGQKYLKFFRLKNGVTKLFTADTKLPHFVSSPILYLSVA